MQPTQSVVYGPHQGKLLKGIVIWTIRREGIEPLKEFLLMFSFQ